MLFERKKKSVVFSCFMHSVFLCVSIWDRDEEFFLFYCVPFLPFQVRYRKRFFYILFYLHCHVSAYNSLMLYFEKRMSKNKGIISARVSPLPFSIFIYFIILYIYSFILILLFSFFFVI